MREIRSFYRGIKQGIINLVVWFPIIWRDRDFDQMYLYYIVHKKLANMEKFFRGDYAITMEAPQTANEIQEVKDSLRRYIDREHWDNVKFDTGEFLGFKDGQFKVDRDNPNYKLWKEACDKADEMEIEDLQKAFRIIGEKSLNWWD